METKMKLLNKRGLEFYRFMVKEGAWDIFAKRLKENWDNDESELYEIVNKEVNPIDSAFIWFATPEGYFFWEKLSREWAEHIEDYSEE